MKTDNSNNYVLMVTVKSGPKKSKFQINIKLKFELTGYIKCVVH